MSRRDPYLYEDVPVLRNLPGIKNGEELKRVEGDLTRMSMGIVYAREYEKFNTETLCDIHRTIFGGLYEWAGEFRTIPIMKAEEVLGGDTVRYAAPSEIKKQLDVASKEIARIKTTANKKDIVFKIVRITAAIWQTHPFREGNTRSVVAFSALLAAKLGVQMDYELFANHAAYVRNALVWCTQGIYSIYDYLERIYFDAAGLLDDQPEQMTSKQKDYSTIEGYRVADYKEQPHTYAEDSE
jgi:cell filamentation protein